MTWEDILQKEEINKFRKPPSPKEFLGEQEYNKVREQAGQDQQEENQQEEERQKIPDYYIRDWTQDIDSAFKTINELNQRLQREYRGHPSDSLMGATLDAYYTYQRPVTDKLNQAKSAIPSSNTDESKTFIDALGEAWKAADILLNQVDKGRNYTPYWAGVRRYGHSISGEATVGSIRLSIFSVINSYLNFKYGATTPEYNAEMKRIQGR